MTRRVLQFNLEAVIGLFDGQGRLKGTQGKRTAVFEADFNRTLAHYAALVTAQAQGETECLPADIAPSASESSSTHDTGVAESAGMHASER